MNFENEPQRTEKGTESRQMRAASDGSLTAVPDQTQQSGERQTSDGETSPRVLPILPVRGLVVFPGNARTAYDRPALGLEAG